MQYLFVLGEHNFCWKPREREPSILIYCKCNDLSHLEKKSSFLAYPEHMDSLESVRVDE